MLKTSLFNSAMRAAATLVLAIAVWGVSVSASHATRITFDATMNGAQEVPPNVSTATGAARVIFDTTNNTIDVHISFTEIKVADIDFPNAGPLAGLAFGNFGPLHIHAAGVGVNGPIVVPFPNQAYYTDTAAGFDFNVTDVSFSSVDPGVSDLVTPLLAGDLYLNLHTLRGDPFQFAGGEIRGQLARVPEPGSALILGAGLLVLGRLRRRR